ATRYPRRACRSGCAALAARWPEREPGHAATPRPERKPGPSGSRVTRCRSRCTAPRPGRKPGSALAIQQEEVRLLRTPLVHRPQQGVLVDAAEVVDDRQVVVDHRRADL